jgi:uncharacterized protein YndB with AHSA1/START domain
MPLAPVRKEIVVEASQAQTFRVFTEEHGAWWPLASHHIGAQPAETAIIEPRVGGRWFERASDGTECLWGKVLVWDPPSRLVLAWQIGADWRFDEAVSTEVEVRFVVLDPARTRVELEHRLLDRLGTGAEGARAAFDSDGGWAGLLRRFSAHAEGRPVSA